MYNIIIYTWLHMYVPMPFGWYHCGCEPTPTLTLLWLRTSISFHPVKRGWTMTNRLNFAKRLDYPWNHQHHMKDGKKQPARVINSEKETPKKRLHSLDVLGFGAWLLKLWTLCQSVVLLCYVLWWRSKAWIRILGWIAEAMQCCHTETWSSLN